MLKKRIVALALSSLMAFGMVVNTSEIEVVRAAGTIGKLNGQSYSSFKKLVDDLEDDYEGKTVTIEMTANWNAAGSDDFDRRLVIPSKCKATLNMHGYVYNRNLAFRKDTTMKGGLVIMGSESTLTINGASNESEKQTPHPLVATYSSVSTDGKANRSVTINGGVMTGGCSTTGAGCIEVGEKCVLTLNDMTIAGCGTYGGLGGGYGGGIYIIDDYSTVRMNNSTITGCFASRDGGGIYANDEPTTIELNNSSIDMNYANEDGGGIYVNDEKINISGLNGSKITNNQAGDNGGGLYYCCGDSTLAGFLISGNKAHKNGGGVYSDDTGLTLSGLTIKLNTAELGGGFYVNQDENEISSCTITDNTATKVGGGVYVADDVDKQFVVKGVTVIKNNFNKNLFMSADDPEDCRVNFSLSKGADVRVYYYDTDGKDAIMVTEGKVNDRVKTPNCIQFLTAENSGYHFTFNSAPNQRKIYYVKDGKDSSASGDPVNKPQDPTDVNAKDAINNPGQTSGGKKAGIVGTVGPGGASGTTYNLIRGFTRHEETDDGSHDSASVFYYSDAFFDADPYTYNSHLATASLNMAYAGMYLRTREPEDANGNYYYNRHAAGRQFLADIGCPDQKIYVNLSNEMMPETDSIGVTIGSKELAKADGTKTGYILVPVVIRGGGYELEWASNATLNKAQEVAGMEAYGFSKAAGDVIKEIDKYIADYGLTDAIKDGKVKFWVAGYSRAGATANITSKRLIEKYADGSNGKKNQVFGYTCEAPMGGTDNVEKLDDKSKYYCIHNLINAVDIVPHVAPQLMGFKRYGVDHYIPGTGAGQVTSQSVNTSMRSSNGPAKATTYKDNSISYIKTLPQANKDKMQKQLRAVDSGIVLDDYFHPMAMKFVPSVSFYEEGDYGGNNIEAFVADFLRFAQEGIEPGEKTADSQAISNRNVYVDNVQPALRDTLALVFTMDDDTSSSIISRAKTIKSKIDTLSGDISMLDIYRDVISGWYLRTDEEKKDICSKLWKKLEATGAFEFLDSKDLAKLQGHWPKLADMIFTLVNGDYSYNPKKYTESDGWAKGANDQCMFLATFATYASYILQNHYPEVNLAWARSYDSYYDNEFTEYEIVKGGLSVKIPSAAGKDSDGNALLLEEGADKNNRLSGNQKIILEVEDIVGEAVYFDLVDNTSGNMLETNRLYRGGINLSLDLDQEHSYTITTYAISYGVRSSKAVYNINLVNTTHKVTVEDSSGSDDLRYKEKDQVTVNASEPSDKYFTAWTAVLLDDEGNVLSDDITDTLLGSGKDKIKTVFTMPEAGSDLYDGTNAFPERYALKITAHYKNRIKKIDSTLDQPVAGQALASEADISFDNGKSGKYPVSWTYTYDDGGETKTVAATGNAYNDTVYTATVIIPQDKGKDIIFAPTDKLKASNSDGTVKSVTRNDADGSVKVVIEFDATEVSGGEERPDVLIKLVVKALDLNLNAYDDNYTSECYVLQDSEVVITAPDVSDEIFSAWDFGSSGITLADGYSLSDKTVTVKIPTGVTGTELSIDARFIPVINKIEASVDAPVAGKKIQTVPDADSLKVTISNKYEVDPDYVAITWTPEPLADSGDKKADYLTSYTVTISLAPKSDENGNYIYAKGPNDADYKRTAAIFRYSEDLKATVNGKDVTCDRDNSSVSFTFPMTRYTLVSVGQPDDIAGIAHGTGEDGIRKVLPKTVDITLDDGSVMAAAVDWTKLSASSRDDSREGQTWTCKGKVKLPDSVVNKDDISLDVKVLVLVVEADTAKAPVATLEEGIYTMGKTTKITTKEKGGTTYYTLDGSDPSKNKSCIKYNGGEISISPDDLDNLKDEIKIDENGNEVKTGRKMIVLSAFTKKKGFWDSAVVSYSYVFEKKDPVYVQAGVSVVWDDADNCDGIRPDSVTVKLLSSVDGKKAAEVKDDKGETLTLELSKANKWKGVFAELPEDKDGKKITYSVMEVLTDVITGADTEKTYSYEIVGDQTTGFTISNIHKVKLIDISGKILWNDNDDEKGARPSSVTVRLKADGSEVAKIQVKKSSEWKFTFKDLPLKKDGKAISYSVSEDSVKDYTVKVSGDLKTGFTVNNTYAPSSKPTEPAPAISLKLNKTKLNVVAGKTCQLKATLTGTDSKITWKSSNPNIASVDKNGKISAKSAGAVTITASVKGKKATCKVTVLYKDVTDNSSFWFKPVNYLTAAGIVKGYENGTLFEPVNHQKCTRAQMVTFIWRMAGSPEPKTKTCRFTDVKKTDYFYKACLWGNEKHIVEGYKDNTFGPGIVCARRHAVTFLWRYAGKPKVAASVKNRFSDVKKGSYYYDAVLWSQDKKILVGYSDGTFRPNAVCLRRQMATFLYKYDKYINGKG